MPNSIGSAQNHGLSSLKLQQQPEPGLSTQSSASKNVQSLPTGIKHRSGQQIHKSHHSFVRNARDSSSSSLKQLGERQQRVAEFSAKMRAAKLFGKLAGGMTFGTAIAVTTGIALFAGFASGGIGFIPIAVAAGGALLSLALGLGVSTKVTSADTKQLDDPSCDVENYEMQARQGDETASDHLIAKQSQENAIDVYRSTRGGPPLGTPGNPVNAQHAGPPEPGRADSEEHIQMKNDHLIADAWQDVLNDQHDLTSGKLNLDQITPGQRNRPPEQAEEHNEGDPMTMEGNEVPLPEKFQAAASENGDVVTHKQAALPNTAHKEGEA